MRMYKVSLSSDAIVKAASRWNLPTHFWSLLRSGRFTECNENL